MCIEDVAECGADEGERIEDGGAGGIKGGEHDGQGSGAGTMGGGETLAGVFVPPAGAEKSAGVGLAGTDSAEEAFEDQAEDRGDENRCEGKGCAEWAFGGIERSHQSARDDGAGALALLDEELSSAFDSFFVGLQEGQFCTRTGDLDGHHRTARASEEEDGYRDGEIHAARKRYGCEKWIDRVKRPVKPANCETSFKLSEKREKGVMVLSCPR